MFKLPFWNQKGKNSKWKVFKYFRIFSPFFLKCMHTPPVWMGKAIRLWLIEQHSIIPAILPKNWNVTNVKVCRIVQYVCAQYSWERFLCGIGAKLSYKSNILQREEDSQVSTIQVYKRNTIQQGAAHSRLQTSKYKTVLQNSKWILFHANYIVAIKSACTKLEKLHATFQGWLTLPFTYTTYLEIAITK